MIKISKNTILHERRKHFDVRFHFMRNLVEDGTIELLYCRIEHQIAYVLTKQLKVEAF